MWKIRRPLRLAAVTITLSAMVTGGQAGAATGTAPESESPPGGPSGISVPTLAWAACEPAGFQCASAQVPLDYRDPGGKTISLAVTRLPAADPQQRIGSLFVNPGGPGSSGVGLAARLAGRLSGLEADALPQAVLDRFDIVGFDPRGVAGSSPAIACFDGAQTQQAFVESTATLRPGGFQRGMRLAKRFTTACVENSGGLLPYIGTEYVARDLDLLRAAVGDDKLTYLGLSYGTYLGTVYANLFPGRTRALAFDSAHNPPAHANRQYQFDLDQYVAQERTLNRFFDWCAATPDRCPFGDGKPARSFDRLLADLDANPVRDSTGVVANGATFAYLVIFGGLNGGRAAWPQFAKDLTDAEKRTGALIAPVSSDPEGAFLSANAAVDCADRIYPPSLAKLRARLAHAVAAAPRLGPVMAYGPSPSYDHAHATICLQWPAERASRYTGRFNAPGSAPILVVGTTGDPDTPFRDSVALSKTLDNGRLLTFDGEGHRAYFISACVKAAISAYLIDGTLPKPGTVCDDDVPPGQIAASNVRGSQRLPAGAAGAGADR